MRNWHVVMFMAVAFAVLQKAFFGFKLMPEAPLDVLCDGVTIALFAMALLTRAVENRPKA